MAERLYRSEDDVIIAGVCSGVAEYFDTDPSLVRLAWIIFTLLGGSGILLYVVAVIIIPRESDLKQKKSKNSETGDIEKKEVYECEKCSKQFDSERGLKVHKGQKH